MNAARPGSTRDLVLIALAVVLLAGAGLYFALYGSPGEPAPDDQFMSFRCQACGASFRMSHREFERVWDERKFTRDKDGRTLLYECPKCGQLKAERVPEPAAPAPGPE